MRIKNIELKNYRNYDNLNINFNDNLNIIIGDNAQGKTNLLESIYVLAVTKSFLSNKYCVKFFKSDVNIFSAFGYIVVFPLK